ncbi:MAG: hypothetical protein J6T10_02800 [Methanobrevibacter sp.]|nr:hypothetical protein [Methanobrevibacter sp.]
MDGNTFMGLLIAAIGSLLAIISVIVALIIKPIINLNKSIVKLNDSIDRLNEDNQNLSIRVKEHGKEIDENARKILIHEKEIEHLKERLK